MGPILKTVVLKTTVKGPLQGFRNINMLISPWFSRGSHICGSYTIWRWFLTFLKKKKNYISSHLRSLNSYNVMHLSLG